MAKFKIPGLTLSTLQTPFLAERFELEASLPLHLQAFVKPIA